MMKHWRNISASLALAAVCVGCGQSEPTTTSARESVPKSVVKWKHTPKTEIGTAQGLIIETQGDEIATATLYDLKDGPGFNVDRRLSRGHATTKEGKLVLPIVTALGSVEEWVANGGLHWELKYFPTATNLTVNQISAGLPVFPSEFVRFVE